MIDAAVDGTREECLARLADIVVIAPRLGYARVTLPVLQHAHLQSVARVSVVAVRVQGAARENGNSSVAGVGNGVDGINCEGEVESGTINILDGVQISPRNLGEELRLGVRLAFFPFRFK